MRLLTQDPSPLKFMPHTMTGRGDQIRIAGARFNLDMLAKTGRNLYPREPIERAIHEHAPTD